MNSNQVHQSTSGQHDFLSLMDEYEAAARLGGSGSDYMVQMARNLFRGEQISVSIGDIRCLSEGNRDLLWKFMNVYSMGGRSHSLLARFADDLDEIAKERRLDGLPRR